MKFLTGLLAFISSFFAGDSPKLQPLPHLNSSIISFNETYFAPVVAEPGNFPFTKAVTIALIEDATKESSKPIATPLPIQPTPPVPAPVLPPAPAPAPPSPPPPASDSYLADPEPVADWYTPILIRGNSADGNSTVPEMTFDREFWRIEVIAYWAPGDPSHPPVKKDYFKLEVYDKKTDKLIYTMTSGTDETIHKFQAFKKPGAYYFKTYPINPSQFEITFTHSLKIVQ